MSPRVPRTVVALAGALVALGSVAAIASAAPVGRAGACTDGTGITVVVDATAFGDGVVVRCAPQPVRSGFEALTKAGFTYEGTTRFPGLLCRIDGEPASDPCHNAPPADAYWAYWHAARGGEWTYSSSGASRTPAPGSVEGWAFGDDATPGIAPPAPSPSTTTTRAPTVTTRPPAGGGSSPPPAGASTTTVADADDAPTTTAGVDGETTTTRAGAVAIEGGGSDEGANEPASERSVGSGTDGGSPAGAVVGLVAAAGLGAGTLVAARRRRGTPGEPA